MLRAHPAALGEMVNDQVYEIELVGVELSLFQELREGALGGGAVQSNPSRGPARDEVFYANESIICILKF